MATRKSSAKTNAKTSGKNKRKRGTGTQARKKASVRSGERLPGVEYTPLQDAFVIMPFDRTDELERAYAMGIEPTLRECGLGCVRVDRIRHTTRIGNRIDEALRRSYFVIADLTKERPNCYYELGFAHALGKPAILLARAGTVLHFDVRDYPCIFYESEEHLQKELKETILQAVLTTAERDPDEDEHNGNFGRCAIRNGRLLMARVLRSYYESPKDEIQVCDIRLDVTALPGAQPLSGQVRFYADESYDREYHVQTVEDGYASIEFGSAAGAFTIGAEADQRATKLELDLATIPGAPCTFYPKVCV
jgi:hypothetical protein